MDVSVTTVKTEGGVSVVQVAGEVDVYTAPTLRQHLRDATASGSGGIVVDMTGVTFLDSTGLGVLVGAMGRVREADGSMRLVVTSDHILKVLRITGLDALIPVDADLDTAVAAAGNAAG
jgi:anti-sigma B factor antagonist